MSRIGKQPVRVPAGLEVAVQGRHVKVKGKLGELELTAPDPIDVTWDAAAREIRVTRPNDARQNRALHGLTRALIANMVTGVQQPFQKVLEIVGVGYQASLAGKQLKLQVGYANTIVLDIPPLVTCEVPAPTQIIVRSIDKHACGQFAANIRKCRPPEPYKGKGIRYQGEHIRRKVGKAMAGG